MANHGTIAYGADLDAAVEQRAAARMGVHDLYWRAAAVGDAARARRRPAARPFVESGRRARLRRASRRERMSDDERRSPSACTSSTCSCARWRRSPRARAGSWSTRSGSPPPGPAGGTAITLAKLGAEVRSAGAIGTDALGDVLIELLGARRGRHLAARPPRRMSRPRPACCPIRPDGSRPAFHVVGANATYAAADAPVGRDRRRHAPAPRRARVHGRRGGGADPRPSPASTASPPRPTSSRPASRRRRSSTGSHRRSSTSTTCCPTTSRCWG